MHQKKIIVVLTCIFHLQLDKRAHHNALERKRRDHIKESFNSLRDAIPGIHGEKVRFCCTANCLAVEHSDKMYLKI